MLTGTSELQLENLVPRMGREFDVEANVSAAGSLIGFRIIDFEVHLLDGKYHDVDSSAQAFEIADRAAMREAAQKAGIRLLEPVMNIEVVTPEDSLGDVIGALNSRGGTNPTYCQ